MSDNTCERCGKPCKPFSTIELTYNEGKRETVCNDCFNEEMALKYEVEDFKNYIKYYTVCDSDSISHQFEIQKKIMGVGIFWEAHEIKDDGTPGYLFEVNSEMDGNQYEAVQKLYNKIDSGLRQKSVETTEFAGHMTKSIVDSKVIGRIEWDETEGDNPCFIIDGRTFSLYEFGQLLMGFEGFNFKLTIHDITDDIE